MYKVVRVLNHNTVIAALDDSEKLHGKENLLDKEDKYLLMGKGIGFGKKTGAAAELKEAEKMFGDIDRNILFSLADHIFYAVKRMKNGERISNPLTEDIRLLFHMEYKAALCVIPVIQEKFGILIDDDEVGYIALHVHSAIDKKIDIMSLAYNRLMNHVRYMIVRAIKGEKLKMSLNDYMSIKYPDEFAMAEKICDEISGMIKHKLNKAEIGYLAMHICRVTSGELEAEE